MKFLLLFFIWFTCLPISAWGVGYSCRDVKGTKYFADSPLRLPETCKDKIWQFEQSDFYDNKTSAPDSAPQPKPKNNLFQQMIEEDTLARKIDQFKQRATDAAGKYAQGTELLNSIKRIRHSGFRARKEKGEELIRAAHRSKQNILNDVEVLQLSPKKRVGIEKQLELIH